MQSVNLPKLKEDSMKHISVSILGVFTILISGFFLSFDAAADENTCTLKADADKVHLKVWDEDSGQDRQDKIFEGWLKSGEEKKIKSTTGFIVFSYKEAEDDRSYGDNHKTCKGGNTIRVP
jgi:uncharacterized protein YxeA